MIISMSMWIGVLFLLCGFSLAVLLGIVLYRDPKREVRPHENILRTEKKPEAA